MAQFIIAKHRSGAVGDVKLRFRNQFARFENWVEDSDSNSNLVTVGSSINTSNNSDPFGSGGQLSGGSADISPNSDEPDF